MWSGRLARVAHAMPVVRKYLYRRDLPHLQPDLRTIFVTFRTCASWILPPQARDLVLQVCRARDGRQVELEAVVVMPEHVHLLFRALSDKDNETYSLPEILHGIKSESAHAINKLLGRTGPVWQPESFDHVVRRFERDKLEYIRQNPVRRSLVRQPEDYPWLWVRGRG